MDTPTALIDRLTQQVELLLERLDAAQSNQAALQESLATVTEQRNALQSRLVAARTRVDALLEQLPLSDAPSSGD